MSHLWAGTMTEYSLLVFVLVICVLYSQIYIWLCVSWITSHHILLALGVWSSQDMWDPQIALIGQSPPCLKAVSKLLTKNYFKWAGGTHVLLFIGVYRTGKPPLQLWPDGMGKWVERPAPVLGDRGSEPPRLKHWSSQTNDFKIDTYRFLARCSALLR